MSDWFGGDRKAKKGFLGISEDSWQSVADILGGAANMHDPDGVSPALYAQKQQESRALRQQQEQQREQQRLVGEMLRRQGPQQMEVPTFAPSTQSMTTPGLDGQPRTMQMSGQNTGVESATMPGRMSQDQIDYLRAAGPEAAMSVMGGNLFPKGFTGTVGKNEIAYSDGREVARGPADEPDLPAEQRLAMFVSGGDPNKAAELVRNWKSKDPREAPEQWTQLTAAQAAAAGLPAGGVYERSSRGQTRAVLPPTKETGPGRMKLAAAETGAGQLIGALDTFEKNIKDASTLDFNDALAGGKTQGGQRLISSWTNAALLAKGEQLYNLGVLSGPDLEIIQKNLKDPSTWGGRIASKGAFIEGISQARKIVQDGLSRARTQYGNEPAPGDGGTADPLGIR